MAECNLSLRNRNRIFSRVGSISDHAMKLLLYLVVLTVFIGGFWIGRKAIENSKVKTMRSTSQADDMRFLYFQKIAELDAQAIAYGLCLEDINPFSGKTCPSQDDLMEILAENHNKQDELIHKINWNDIPVAEKKDCKLKCRCSLILRIIEANNIIVPTKILKTLEKQVESITNENKLHCINP